MQTLFKKVCLESLAVCLYDNTIHVVPISHGIQAFKFTDIPQQHCLKDCEVSWNCYLWQHLKLTSSQFNKSLVSSQKNAFRSSRSHEQYLRTVYDDKKSNFNKLLVKNGCLYPSSTFTKLAVECLKFLEVEVLKLLMNYFNLERKYLMN